MTQPGPDSALFGLLSKLYAAVNAHDAEALAALCHENVVWSDPAAGAVLRGREAVYRFHHDTMFRALPDVHVELVDGPYFALDGARVAVRLRIGGTMTGPLDPPGVGPTGDRIEFETAEFSKVEGGRLIEQHVILDMLGLARQIGAVPKPGGGAERASIWLQRLGAWRSRAQHR
jgi:predicted ester cyclase